MYQLSEFINSLNAKDKKHWCIIYEPGMRGNALLRILASHQESWWDKYIMNIGNADDPLEFSETHSTLVSNIEGCKFGTAYLAPHTNMSLDFFCKIDFKNDLAPVKLAIKERYNSPDKYFFTCCHSYADLIVNRYIHTYASKQNSRRNYIQTEAQTGDNVINIDISKLFSYDREEFEDEYIKIINKFDFTPRFTSVRNFILQLLDRETNWKNFAAVLDNDFYKTGF